MFKRFRHQVLNLGIILMFLLSPCLGWSQTNYSVLDFWKYYSDAENLLYKQQAELSFESIEKRKESISMLHTQEDWTERQKLVKDKLLQRPI